MAQYSSSCLISTNHLDLLNSPANRSFNGVLCGTEHAAATNVTGINMHTTHTNTNTNTNQYLNQQQQSNSVVEGEGVLQGNTDQSINILDVGEVHHSQQQQVNLQKSVMSMLRNSSCTANELDEYDSKSSSDNPDAASGEDQEGGHDRPTKKRYHRHSQYQIQEMERVFKECPHPDEKQRMELSRELKLDPRQVKFWFQNKRTQVKAQHERHDNAYLRTENDKLRAENLALRDAIANVTCPNCGGPANLSDSSFDEQQLRIENVRLREEIDRISKIAAKHVGRPISTLNLSSTISPSSTANSTNPNYSTNPNSTQTNFMDHHQQAAAGASGTFMQNSSLMTAGSSLIDNDQQLQLMASSRSGGGFPYMSNYSGSIFKTELLQGLSETEKPMVAEVAMAAMEEFTQLAQASDPLWILQVHQDGHNNSASSGADGINAGISSTNFAMEVLDAQQYLHRFPASRLQYNSSAATSPSFKLARESTRQSAIITMDAPSLVEILMNVANWAETFCSIVSRAFLVEVLSSGVASTQDGAMEIIYAEFQLPSPVVSTRECYFLRYAKRMSYNNSIWAVVDVSIDRPNRTESPRCRRRPSGCMIEDLGNGCSKVTWVEHWEVDSDRAGVHRLYQPLVSSGLAFGAQRWVATLRRQCEAMHATSSMMLGTNPSTDLVCPTLEGRRSLLKLAERMTNNFCGGVSASVAHTWITLSPGAGGAAGTEVLSYKTNLYGNGGAGAAGSDDIRVLIRKSVDDPGRPPGVVLCAATSIWLPLPPSRVFDFLRDERFRTEWDILSNMGPVEEIVHVPKGQDNSNTVSLLRVNAVSSSQPNMLILQECCAEDNTYIVVYAPVDIAAMSAVLNGGDPDCVALLPSGFSILADRPTPSTQSQLTTTSSSSPTTTSPITGSLLTVAFQILVDHVPTAKLSLGSVATVNNLISSTVLRIKNALSCDSTPS